MKWCEAKPRAALRTAVVVVLSFSAGDVVRRLRRGGRGRYSPEVRAQRRGVGPEVQGVDDMSEAFFQGNEFMNVHSDIVEISLVKMTEDGKYDVKLNYLESSDKRGMAGSALSDYEGPIRPMGHAIEITVDAMEG